MAWDNLQKMFKTKGQEGVKMTTEYDYERDCNDIDEAISKEKKTKQDKIEKECFGKLRDDLIKLKDKKE